MTKLERPKRKTLHGGTGRATNQQNAGFTGFPDENAA
jgi:hypothetical protein